MADRDDPCTLAQDRDWASNCRSFAILWGGPCTAMIASLALPPTWRAAVWTAMLAFMGVACLLNARRCGRTHCRLTGPFLLAMAGLVTANALGFLPLGSYAWHLLGGVSLLGFVGLWWASERHWGTYRP